MQVIYAVTNNKGGVGKTHTVFHLAGAFAQAGKRVLVIDLDQQRNLTNLLLSEPPKETIYTVLANDVPLTEAIYPSSIERIWLVPASKELKLLDAALHDEPDGQVRLGIALKELADNQQQQFDYILLDCPPDLRLATRNALAAAKSVIIPLEADRFSIEGLADLVHTVNSMARAVNPGLTIAGALISLFKPRRMVEQAYQAQLEQTKIPLFQTKIKDSTKYREAIARSRPITHYLPTSEQAEAFRNLANELEHVYVES